MSGNSSIASVTNDAESRSHTKSDDKEDIHLSLHGVRLDDSSNHAELPVGFPGFVSSPPLHVQEDVGPFVSRLGPLQDGDPALLQHSTNISQYGSPTGRSHEYYHDHPRLPNQEDILINLTEREFQGVPRPESRASSSFSSVLDASLIHHVHPPGPSHLHGGAVAGELPVNGKTVSLQGLNSHANFLARDAILRTKNLIDQCQISPIENIYRELDYHITSLANSQGLEPSLVAREVLKICDFLTEIEKGLAIFYYSVDSLRRLSIKFSISKLQDPNYLAALAGVAPPVPNLFPKYPPHSLDSPPPSPILTPR